jgi:hypothetical protein
MRFTWNPSSVVHLVILRWAWKSLTACQVCPQIPTCGPAVAKAPGEQFHSVDSGVIRNHTQCRSPMEVPLTRLRGRQFSFESCLGCPSPGRKFLFHVKPRNNPAPNASFVWCARAGCTSPRTHITQAVTRSRRKKGNAAASCHHAVNGLGLDRTSSKIPTSTELCCSMASSICTCSLLVWTALHVRFTWNVFL